MNVFDIIIVLALIFAVYKGFKDGIILQLGGLIGVIIGVWLAYRYGRELGEWLNISSSVAGIVGFCIVLLATIIFIGILGWILGKIFNLVGLGLINKVGGIVLALIKMVIILSVLLVAFTALNDSTDLVPKKHIESSHLYKPVSNVSKHIFPYLSSLKDKITGYDE